MIFNELNTGFRWYDALEKQTRFKEYCQTMCDFALMAPCNDLLPFQIKSDSFGQPTEWLLKYLDGTMLVPNITPSVDPSLSFNLTDSTSGGSGTIEVINTANGHYYGVADWNGNENQTMLDLVYSINNHVNMATPVAGIQDYTHDFVASWDNTTQVFTFSAPVGSGAIWNGVEIHLSCDSFDGCLNWQGDMGQYKTFSGGVNEIIVIEDTDTIDITDCIPFLNQYSLDGHNYLQYNSGDLPGCLPVQMACGKWYSEITDGINIVYSEVFEVMPISDITFEQMKLPLFVGFRFYDSKAKQNRYKEFCENLCNFYLLNTNTNLPPFQIKAPDGVIGVESWSLVSVDEDCEYLLDTSLIEIVVTIDGDRITYYGQDIDDLPCGKFYMVLSDGVTTWYSELIELTDAIPNPTETFYILQETGFKILQETAFGLLQE